MFKIYLNSAAGVEYTGVYGDTEEEAKQLCAKYNAQDGYNPYKQYFYK